MGNDSQKYKQPLYELQKSCTFQMKYPCSTVAINQSGSLILTNLVSRILVFGFDGKSIKSISNIQKHQCSITVLKFFNLRNQFISGSSDLSIIIMPTILNPTKYIQKLKGHKGMIMCIAIHSLNEDLMVSGDYENTIRIWSMQQSSLQWKCIQEIIEHKSQVYGISINEIGNQVVSCDKKQLILVIEKSKNSNAWFVKQKIEAYQHEGAGVSFLTNDRFIIQSISESTIDLYALRQEGRYTKIQSEKLKYCNNGLIRQNLSYNKKMKILTLKTGQKLFIIRFDLQNNKDQSQTKNNELLIKNVQIIDFKTLFFYRAISDDGQYLITRNQLSQSIEVRFLNKSLID
ncbi:unnamed protein product (macronuclear) [Paramecium tetraurelia]|uniref:Uncharacterized protein n=1 Tax=Paramecium tetraurelia TaxID=5888 RepID=A0C706_PARTE|nr:uncharacterized protein GSPATT00035702001 [Paramecium tetraurelia]CAK66573.1 unnamed protein product [Paramecium tetraurelia]|eukprot:XP_001433970.1 hypothetical protein (macronuclear) [Paramecium tetraurelia strain d4-2]